MVENLNKKSFKSKKKLIELNEKKSALSQINLKVVKHNDVPKIKKAKGSSKNTAHDKYDICLEDHETDDSLYLPNFVKNYEGRFLF